MAMGLQMERNWNPILIIVIPERRILMAMVTTTLKSTMKKPILGLNLTNLIKKMVILMGMVVEKMII